MMKNYLLCQHWVALTIPLHITNSASNVWQLVLVCARVCIHMCAAVCGCLGEAGLETTNLLAACSSHCCHVSFPPAGMPGWQGSAWLCQIWEQKWRKDCCWERCWSPVLWHPLLHNLPAVQESDSHCFLLVSHSPAILLFSPHLYALFFIWTI